MNFPIAGEINVLVVNIIDRGRERRVVGTISETSRSSVQTRLATRSPSPPARNGERGLVQKIAPGAISQRCCRSGAERGGLGTRFVLSSLPSNKTQERQKCAVRTCWGGGGSFLWEPRCLWRREAKSPAFIQRTSITLTCPGLVS